MVKNDHRTSWSSNGAKTGMIDDFLSEGTPRQVSIDDGGASYFDNHYNKYYANTMNKLLELEKEKKSGRK